MSEKYFIDQAGDDTIRISESVISKIAIESANQVEGVVYMEQGHTDGVFDVFSSFNAPSSVSVYANDLEYTIDISLTAIYGYNLIDLAEKVQDKVRESIENMTELNLVTVNVRINGIRMAESIGAKA